MFCKKCGTSLHPEARFCKKCGTPTTGTQPIAAVPAPPPPAPPKLESAVPPPQTRQTVVIEDEPPAPAAPPPPPVMPTASSLRKPVTPPANSSLTATQPPVIAVPPPIAREALQPDPSADSALANQAHKKRWRLPAIAIGVAMLLGAGIVWWLRSDTATPPDQPTTAQQNAPAAPTGMVYVPGGELRMGNDAGTESERPAYKVVVKPFFIDRHEVTCEQYAQFIAATGHRAPPGWSDGRYPADAAQHPVTGVDWDDASAYAAWLGKRLPTEQEWEFAARGTDGRRYPWGNEWKSTAAANVDAGNKGRMVNVGSYAAGASPVGVYDMAGNAWEWTASDWVPYPGGTLPASNLPPPLKVIRGGSFEGDRDYATTTFRLGWPARGHDDYNQTGFRCAQDVRGS